MKPSRRFRVLHVGKYYPPHMGGIETHLQILCGELQKVIDVDVLVANPGVESVDELLDGVQVRRLGTLANIAGAPVCRGLIREIRKSPADIIHLHHPHPIAFLAYLLSGHSGRLVVTYHGDITRQRWLGKAFAPLLHLTLQRSAAIIAAAADFVENSKVLRHYRARCRVIPFGIPIGAFRQIDHARVERLRQLHGPRIVLGVGRLVHFKGFHHLIEAMTHIPGKLLLVGDGPERGNLEQRTRELGLTARVEFVGNIDNMLNIAPYYHAADVFALPSIHTESFGIVQIEAMACGTPVVNTQLASGVPSVSPHGMTGLTVPPENSRALADAINCLFDDPARREEYSQAARIRAQQVFSMEQMVERTIRLYDDIVGLSDDEYRLQLRQLLHPPRKKSSVAM